MTEAYPAVNRPRQLGDEEGAVNQNGGPLTKIQGNNVGVESPRRPNHYVNSNAAGPSAYGPRQALVVTPSVGWSVCTHMRRFSFI